MKIWLLPVGIILIKLVLNISNVIYLRERHKLFIDWIADNSMEKYKRLQQSKSRVVSLMKQAGIQNIGTPVTQPVGHGYVASMNATIFENYPTRVKAIAIAISDCFEESIGTYKGRAIDAINPLYWLSLIIYLPSRVCSSLGAKADSVPVKILQGLYWFAALIASALLAFAKPTIVEWLRTLLDKLAG